MKSETFHFHSVTLSLRDLLGSRYIEEVCAAASFLEGRELGEFERIADEKVELYPNEFQDRCDELVPSIGKLVCPQLARSGDGAPTDAFRKAANQNAAPLAGYGFLRVGQDGRLYLVSKSEHYHASLGHSFPGYRLIENAKRLGIANITHNNTRGYVERLLERELVRSANGLAVGDEAALEAVLASRERGVLNRVINLETGSIACEAALKMMLARFYSHEATGSDPVYAGKTPVILVMADNDGGLQANYHGTNIVNQMMRGMWPKLYGKLEASGALVVKSVRINDEADFRAKVEKWDAGQFKIAGFFHEIVLMNYGAILLDKEYLKAAYAICRARDIPICCDEIQSGIWYPEYFLFREYALKPDFVTLGKGFPGGQYPASKVLVSAPMDNLTQFGALVTNGQEELAAISYLVTMAFARGNADLTREIGDLYESELRRVASAHPRIVKKVEGFRLLSSIYFNSADSAVAFTKLLNAECIDISAHTYKANCEPSALTKLPLTASPKVVRFLVGKIEGALAALDR